jgi:ABC-type lipoprotein export system ATPase subunit
VNDVLALPLGNPMKLELRAIRVKNCGPLDDVRVEFYDDQGKTLPVCVLAGANGSGKTTILEVIVWIMQGLGGLDRRSKFSFLGYAQLDILFNGFEFSIAYGDKPDDVVLPAKHYFFFRDGRIHATQIEGLDRIHSQRRASLESPGFGKSSANGDLAPSIFYFPHTRSLDPVAGSQLNKESLPYQFIHRLDVVRSFPGSLNSYLIWLEYAEPEQFKAAQNFLNELDFEGKTFHVQRKTLDILVRTRDGHEHKLHELSSGEQNLLIILLELRRRLLPYSIVLIDEIENSLHPAFQHKLAQALLKMQQMIPFQLIVTTHSWTFAEIFGPSATRVLTKF